MKKLVLITILLCGLVVFAGCEKKPQTEDAVAAPETAVTENESAVTVEEGVTIGDTTEQENVAEKTTEAKKEEAQKSTVKADIKTEVTVQTKTQVPAATVKTFNMVATDFAFTPSTITVNEGDTVRIKLSSSEGTHGLVIPDFAVNKVVSPGAPVVLEFVANKKGTFGFRCSVMCGEGHGDMKGTLIVQ